MAAYPADFRSRELTPEEVRAGGEDKALLRAFLAEAPFRKWQSE